MICLIVGQTRWKDVRPGLCFLGAVSGQSFLLLGKETMSAPNSDPMLRLLFLVCGHAVSEFVTIYRSPETEIEMKEDRIVRR